MFKVAVFETYEILEMKLNTNKVFFIDFFVALQIIWCELSIIICIIKFSNIICNEYDDNSYD